MATKGEYLAVFTDLSQDANLIAAFASLGDETVKTGAKSDNRFLRILAESAGMLDADLPKEVQEQVDHVRRVIGKLQEYDPQARLIERLSKAEGKEQIARLLSLFQKIDPQKHIERRNAVLSELLQHNLESAKEHFLTEIAGKRSTSSSRPRTDDTNSLPVLTGETSYKLSGFGLEAYMYWQTDAVWVMTDLEYNEIANSEIGLTSWTAVGRALRVLADDYTHSAGWTIKKGDLKDANMTGVNAGGTRSFTAVRIPENLPTVIAQHKANKKAKK